MSEESHGSVPKPDTSAPFVERRFAPRRRILKAGLLGFKALHAVLPCTIRDMSPAGARLRINATMAMPSKFKLLVELDGTEVDCDVIWRRGTEAGVQFQGPVKQGTRLRTQVIDKQVSSRV